MNRIQCVGFIMDGNRRWAKSHDKPTLEGHRAGYETLKKTVGMVYEKGIPHMVCYAFSTENWKRAEEEVGYLMKLMKYALEELPEMLRKEGKRIHIRVIGERDAFSPELQATISDVESKNEGEPELTVWMALSYGGRAEVVEAAKRAQSSTETLSEEVFESLLWTASMPDPDILIRTGGERRLSNFLLWKISYSELFFIDTLWPDFGEDEFQSILNEYGTRERRRGR